MDRGAPEDPVEVEDRLWQGARDLARDDECALDVGANQGQSVGRMLAHGFAKIAAVEPADESFHELMHAYSDNPAVLLYNMAISDHDGTLTLAVRSAPILTGQLTAVNMPYRGEHAGEPGVANWGGDQGTREIECWTLDTLTYDLGWSPDFCKIDTEGHEAEVLRGATTVLEKDRPRWLIEFHTADRHDECVRILEDAGYAVDTVRHPHYPPGTYMHEMHGWIKANHEGKPR